jgi:hypothetical protein
VAEIERRRIRLNDAAQQGIDSIRPSWQPSFSPLYSVLARLCSQWRKYYGYTALWNGSGGGPNIHLTRGCQPASILLLAAEPFLSSCDEASLAKEGSTRLEIGATIPVDLIGTYGSCVCKGCSSVTHTSLHRHYLYTVSRCLGVGWI